MSFNFRILKHSDSWFGNRPCKGVYSMSTECLLHTMSIWTFFCLFAKFCQYSQFSQVSQQFCFKIVSLFTALSLLKNTKWFVFGILIGYAKFGQEEREEPKMV